MLIEDVERFKQVSTDLLKAKKKLLRSHDSYHAKCVSDGFSRKRTTSYNARTAEIVEIEVDPLTKELQDLARTIA